MGIFLCYDEGDRIKNCILTRGSFVPSGRIAILSFLLNWIYSPLPNENLPVLDACVGIVGCTLLELFLNESSDLFSSSRKTQRSDFSFLIKHRFTSKKLTVMSLVVSWSGRCSDRYRRVLMIPMRSFLRWTERFSSVSLVWILNMCGRMGKRLPCRSSIVVLFYTIAGILKELCWLHRTWQCSHWHWRGLNNMRFVHNGTVFLVIVHRDVLTNNWS